MQPPRVFVQLRKEITDGCADAVQQAQRLAAAMQSDLVSRLQQQEASTQQALAKRQNAADTLMQQLQDQTAATDKLSKQQMEQQAALTAQQKQQTEQQAALTAQQKQQQEQQAAALAKTTADLRKEVDVKVSELELLLTGRVNDTTTGKAALTDTKLAEIRWACNRRDIFIFCGDCPDRHTMA